METMKSQSGKNQVETNTAEDMIRGSVEKIIFRAEDSGYTIARIIHEKTGVQTTIVGKLASLNPGETGEFSGEWVNNKKFGRQFQVESYRELRPSTIEGIEKYLSSGMVRGIGAELAGRLVKKFGIDTLDVIDNKPDKLCEVEGIGPKRIEKILSAWDKQKNIRDIMVFLQGEGIGPARAVKIYKTYGNSALEIIKKNPYRLAEDIWGIGFKLADSVARRMGIPEESPLRAEAAVMYILEKALEEGHCYLPVDIIRERAEKLDIPGEVLVKSIDVLINSEKLVREDDNIFPERYYRYEKGVAGYLKIMRNTPPRTLPLNPQESIKLIGNDISFEPSDDQIIAIKTSLTEKVSIITGGPGVGKTTILKAFIEILNKTGRAAALCAPTGRAARRMSESVGREAKTIHRLLEYKPGGGSFTYNRNRKLDYDWIIIDEMSMVDTFLFYHLLSAIEPGTCVLMIGDVDQLPSVGAGQVLKDLIESEMIPVTRLIEVHRQKADSLIIKNAHRINAGSMPFVSNSSNSSKQGEPLVDFYFVECDTPEKTREVLLKTVVERIPRRFRLHPVYDVQVLSPMLKGELGVDSLNNELQKALNQASSHIRGFCIGDKVMQMRNNYDKDVFNGDIGKVCAVDTGNELLRIDFDGKIVDYDYSELDEVKIAYCCTVHKSQGSEFPAVVIPLYTGHFILLQRNLLYTAVTRAKKLVVLVGSKKALAIAVKNNKVAMRYTGMKNKVREIM
jgi:exodeoxyribonuclease V alpha subunit